MKKILLSLATIFIGTSCAYDNKGDDAQREANRIYEESLAKCNELKGTYTGTLEGFNEVAEMGAEIYCEVSSQSQTDKNNTTVLQVVPEIYLYRKDLPIPSILQILDQGSGIGMRPKVKGAIDIPGESGGSIGTSNSGLPDGMTAPPGSLLASIRYEAFTGFEGSKSGSEIIGDLRSNRPLGKLRLRKNSSEPSKKALASLSEQIEKELVKQLEKYMGDYHGCLFLDQVNSSTLPIGIWVKLSIVDGVFQGKTMKALRGRFYRNDLPGNPALANLWMRTGLAWTRVDGKQILSVTLEAIQSPQNVNYVPVLNGSLIVPIEELNQINSSHWFFGTFESKQELGQFRLFRQDKPIKDCRVYKNQLKP